MKALLSRLLQIDQARVVSLSYGHISLGLLGIRQVLNNLKNWIFRITEFRTNRITLIQVIYSGAKSNKTEYALDSGYKPRNISVKIFCYNHHIRHNNTMLL